MEDKIGYRVIDNFLPRKEFLKIEKATITFTSNQATRFNINFNYF